jgi:hypothetical protein
MLMQSCTHACKTGLDLMMAYVCHGNKYYRAWFSRERRTGVEMLHTRHFLLSKYLLNGFLSHMVKTKSWGGGVNGLS